MENLVYLRHMIFLPSTNIFFKVVSCFIYLFICSSQSANQKVKFSFCTCVTGKERVSHIVDDINNWPSILISTNPEPV